MIGVAKRGHIVSANNFIESIIRKFDEKREYHSFVPGIKTVVDCAMLLSLSLSLYSFVLGNVRLETFPIKKYRYQSFICRKKGRTLREQIKKETRKSG